MDSSSKASFSSGSGTLSNPIRSILHRLRRKPNKEEVVVDGSSVFTRSELHDEKTVGNVSKLQQHQHHLLLPTRRESAESLLAQAFAGVSAVKAAYAQLQIAQSPYDPDAIQRSDRAIVAELKHLSYLKHSYLSRQQHFSHESRVLAQIQEQRNAIKTFEITLRNMESTLRNKDRELTSLGDRLLESDDQNWLLESKLRPKSSIAALHNLHLSGLDPTHFLKALRHAMLSVTNFLQHLLGSAEPPISVESQVCNHMFSGFNRHHFGLRQLGETFDRRRFFEEFAGFRGRSLKELLDGREALFQGFCRAKFESLPVVAKAGGGLFLRFAEMARRVWLLHLLFFSFEPEAEASIFVVERGCRYSEVYMESVGVERPQERRRKEVAFTVVPGFKVRRTVIQCKVYLRGADGWS